MVGYTAAWLKKSCRGSAATCPLPKIQSFHFVVWQFVIYILAEITGSDKGSHDVRDSRSEGTGTRQSASHPIMNPAAPHTRHIVGLMCTCLYVESKVTAKPITVFNSHTALQQAHHKHTNVHKSKSKHLTLTKQQHKSIYNLIKHDI